MPVYLTRNADLGECVRAAMEGESRSETVRMGERWVRILANPVSGDDQQDGVVCLLLDVTEKQRKAERMKQEFPARNGLARAQDPPDLHFGLCRDDRKRPWRAQPEDVKKFAGTIHREAGRMLSLISDIIKLSELDEGGSAAAPNEEVSTVCSGGRLVSPGCVCRPTGTG